MRKFLIFKIFNFIDQKKIRKRNKIKILISYSSSILKYFPWISTFRFLFYLAKFYSTFLGKIYDAQETVNAITLHGMVLMIYRDSRWTWNSVGNAMRGRCSGVKRLLHVTFPIEELPYWLDSCQEFTKKSLTSRMQ